MAKSSSRVLLLFRSDEVVDPHCWGCVSGAFKPHKETPAAATKREIYEETGFTENTPLIPLLVFRDGSFTFYNHLALVDEEFTPNLGWESDDSKWVELGHWPSPLHKGMLSLFNDQKSMDAIKHYADMFRGEEIGTREQDHPLND